MKFHSAFAVLAITAGLVAASAQAQPPAGRGGAQAPAQPAAPAGASAVGRPAIGNAQRAAPADQMIKFTSIWEVPGDNTRLDQWYRTTHSRQALDYVGPWLTRYWTYRSLEVPAEADKFNLVRYRNTEMWYRNVATRDDARNHWRTLSPPPTDPARYPNKNTIAEITVPVDPTDKFVATYPMDRDNFLRWVVFIRYPANVRVEDGERWFVNVHAPEQAKLPGLRRFVCSKSVDPLANAQSWVRVCEYWFNDYAAWSNAFIKSPPTYTAPSWSQTYPYVQLVSMFTTDRPDMDFLRDNYRLP